MQQDRQARDEIFDFLYKLWWYLDDGPSVKPYAEETQKFLTTFKIPGTRKYTVESPASEYPGTIRTTFTHPQDITTQQFVADLYKIYFQTPLTIQDLTQIIRENPDTFYEAAEEYRRPYADLWEQIEMGEPVYRHQLFPGRIALYVIEENDQGIIKVDLEY